MLTASIVLYNNDIEKLKKSINSFLETDCKTHLYLIDNSETENLKQSLNYDSDVTYIHSGINLGFGAGHNKILNKIKDISSFHLILNPDVYFDKNVLIELMTFLKENPQIGVLGPKVLYPNGDLQHSIRKFPKPQDLFIRRIPFLKKILSKQYRRSHYLDISINKPIEVDSLSGCFQLFRTEVLNNINGFDERYFMYLEDIDICKKVKKLGYNVYYYPEANIYHYFEKGSAKKLKLVLIHFHSFLKYFFKWWRN
ncbi:glycosyltransferase family 2 protein [Aquimarina sp. 2201CG14-23]|uniref:glycosyltransferase family 2 protein n=1 Tax=Aquimarina mycalae TaxID=3040073 RepID=UPI002478212C|nr:glycosyltransferase family 2 protein [Aquimarina sp. 2201CG14-23]MDH7446371.1 glycosyltransferase family 2 protein [Aquimarina sp. 2201CG14-23]